MGLGVPQGPHGSLASSLHAGFGQATSGVSASRAPDFLQQAGGRPRVPAFNGHLKPTPPQAHFSLRPAAACEASARHPALSAPGRQQSPTRTCPRGSGRGQPHPRRASTDGPGPCVPSALALAAGDRHSGRLRPPLPLGPAEMPPLVTAVPALSFHAVTQKDLIKNCPQKPSASSRKTSPPGVAQMSSTAA